jgi:hypothetical protein
MNPLCSITDAPHRPGGRAHARWYRQRAYQLDVIGSVIGKERSRDPATVDARTSPRPGSILPRVAAVVHPGTTVCGSTPCQFQSDPPILRRPEGSREPGTHADRKGAENRGLSSAASHPRSPSDALCQWRGRPSVSGAPASERGCHGTFHHSAAARRTDPHVGPPGGARAPRLCSRPRSLRQASAGPPMGLGAQRTRP